ncbi:glycosyltransferase family 1 protein [Amniculicola lignicola CBS 123094]|uniref:UDP-N-acetylglucosamine transferase subunit ALG13 n=1 Tax=Amniculicola lignicola CBS 123094 TaxID=1392246 RepID=A0A6A5WRV3_9PLEO|nr:glycosyltransferase family 1 protein [Amniculicola lignicola CBS 123094]
MAADKICFVTTGATAPFIALIEAVLKPDFLDAIREAGYTRLLVQHGTAKQTFDTGASIASIHLDHNPGGGRLVINGFDFSDNGLVDQFKLVQKAKGLVISHAGSGTILAVLRYGLPLIVVPNTQLLDNHQDELATAMEKSNYLLKGDVNNLAKMIPLAEGFRIAQASFPPITSGKHRETKTFAAIMDESLGFME